MCANSLNNYPVPKNERRTLRNIAVGVAVVVAVVVAVGVVLIQGDRNEEVSQRAGS